MSTLKNRLRMTCPYCGKFLGMRTSERMSPVYIRGIAECSNCTFRGHVSIEIEDIAYPSNHPGWQKLDIPLTPSPHLQAQINKGFQMPAENHAATH
ncbi:hypothetical protein [Carnimonas bestiolae]|uniref:hypothetical protein n=1 Tax=Carnimonas bestiolae TaxID=3402172 RepID=UPI003EDC7A6C